MMINKFLENIYVISHPTNTQKHENLVQQFFPSTLPHDWRLLFALAEYTLGFGVFRVPNWLDALSCGNRSYAPWRIKAVTDGIRGMPIVRYPSDII